MKNLFTFLCIVALTAIIGFSMVACGGDEESDPLQGTWTSIDKSAKMTFSDNNWVWKKSNGDNNAKGTFSKIATQITFNLTNWTESDGTWADPSPATGTFDYVISGKSLTFTHISGQDLALPTNWTK